MKDIAKKTNTLNILKQFNLTATKKYGQNFLIDLNTVQKIVNSTPIDQETGVIEVGPGIGALSEQLAYKAKKVVCFEIDERLKNVLSFTLGEFQNIDIVFQDFLTIDLKKEVNELKKTCHKVCIVANLPYYITSDILEFIIVSNADIESVHVMVQKEVASKLTDQNVKSPLSLMMQSVGTLKIDMNISRNVFMPSPHVDSAILSLYRDKDYNLQLTKLLKTAFTQKRKTIYNNLKPLFKEETLSILEKEGIKKQIRPEELTIDDYMRLLKYEVINDES